MADPRCTPAVPPTDRRAATLAECLPWLAEALDRMAQGAPPEGDDLGRLLAVAADLTDLAVELEARS